MPVAKGVTQHFFKIWYNGGKNNGGFNKTVIAHKNFLCDRGQSLGTLDKKPCSHYEIWRIVFY
jgi:hypothetical protein